MVALVKYKRLIYFISQTQNVNIPDWGSGNKNTWLIWGKEKKSLLKFTEYWKKSDSWHFDNDLI